MTYRDLVKKLNKLTDEQLGMDVTIFVEDEFYAAQLRVTGPEANVLDGNHPYLKIKNSENAE